MIELTNIKATDTIGQLRGQINTMQNEIMADQPFVGVPVNPSVKYYKASTPASFNGEGVTKWSNATLIGTNEASTVESRLVCLCLPSSKGVFIANVWGVVEFTSEPTMTGSTTSYDFAVVNIPAITMATTNGEIATFISCDQLGIPTAPTSVTNYLTGVVSKPVMQLSTVGTDPAGLSLKGIYLEQGDSTCNLIYHSKVIQ